MKTIETFYIAYTKNGYLDDFGTFSNDFKKARIFSTPIAAKRAPIRYGVKCKQVRVVNVEDHCYKKLLGFSATFKAMIRCLLILNIFFKKSYVAWDRANHQYVQNPYEGSDGLNTALLFTKKDIKECPIKHTTVDYEPVKIYLNGDRVDIEIEKRIKRYRKYVKKLHLQRHNLNF